MAALHGQESLDASEVYAGALFHDIGKSCTTFTGEDGKITKELYNTLITIGKGPLYIKQANGTFEVSTKYEEGTPYYSNLTSLWGYLNDIKSKFPLYQANWSNNDSNSIGYIKNRPQIIRETPKDEDIKTIEDLRSKSFEDGELYIAVLWDDAKHTEDQ